MRFQESIIALCLLSVCGSWSWGQITQTSENPDETQLQQPLAEDNSSAKNQELYQRFSETLTGAKLVGRFTLLGKEDDLPAKEEYAIHSATKLPRGDYWLIKARIKYGDTDLTVPIPLEVKWAGETPVITLTNLTIPGLGTFSSRVVFYNDKYAGTWTHGQAGGHLFGTVQPIDNDE